MAFRFTEPEMRLLRNVAAKRGLSLVQVLREALALYASKVYCIGDGTSGDPTPHPDPSPSPRSGGAGT